MRKIRVAFFADILQRDFDGATRTIYKIIDGIPDQNFEFLFFCGVPPQAQDDFKYKYIQLPTIRIPLNETYKMALPFVSKYKMDKSLKKFKPDVIHIATPSLLGNFALSWAKSHNIKTISIYHTHFLSYIDYYLKSIAFLIPLAKRIVTNRMKQFYEKCDKVYVPTTAIMDELQSLGLNMSNVSLWQRGMDKLLFNPSKRDLVHIRNITGNNRPNIIFVSRLVWEKNLETLRDIYLKIKESKMEINFLIVGDGVARQELEATMPGAIFLGNQDHETLSVLYASSDIFIFTSVSESYGNVVIEAMASGLPCIIANGGGSASLVHHGVSGFLCEPNNPDQYIDYIYQLLADEKLYQDTVKSALVYTQKLNWETLLDRYFKDVTVLADQYGEPVLSELIIA